MVSHFKAVRDLAIEQGNVDVATMKEKLRTFAADIAAAEQVLQRFM
jgi:hypothetical protein